MNGDFVDWADDVLEALKRAGWLSWAVAAGWLIWPYAVTACCYPGDVLGMQAKLQGLSVPDSFTMQQLVVGEAEALIALAVLGLLQTVLTVLFYRKAQMAGTEAATPVLWPLALVVGGVLSNAAWFFGSGAWDTAGFVIGLSSTALTVGAEMSCNRLGRKFVLGTGAAAPPMLYSPAWPTQPVWPAQPAGPAEPAWPAQPAGPVFYDIPE